ncbi:MAG: hypothetical protein ACRDRH_17075 [Pseudonocardia sp.]
MNRVAGAVWSGMREAYGLLVDDGAVAVGTLLAVAVAALLSTEAMLGAGDAIGWVLFALVWLALAVSLHRARTRHRGRDRSRPRYR